LEYVDTVNQDRFVPFVIETSGGVSRSFMAFLCNAYDEEKIVEEGKEDTRVVMRFNPKLAPVTLAVFPLVNKDGMPEYAHQIYKDMQKYFRTQYDTAGAIGRRYRRQDEVGTPFCVTVDGQTLEDHTVTIRNRDSMLQDRIPVSKIRDYIEEKMY
jgi:glycyl-tRNA synthetase